MGHIRLGELPHSRRYYGFVAATLLVLLVLLLGTSRSQKKPDGAPEFQQISIGKDNTTNVLDWSRFAYVQYVTNLPYLCNSVMLFESLYRLGSKPHRLLLYPSSFSTENNSTVSAMRHPYARSSKDMVPAAPGKDKVSLVTIDRTRNDDRFDRQSLIEGRTGGHFTSQGS